MRVGTVDGLVLVGLGVGAVLGVGYWIVGAPHPYGYRNRIRVHSAGGVTGFFAYDARALVDVQECLLAVPEVNRALRRLRGNHSSFSRDFIER